MKNLLYIFILSFIIFACSPEAEEQARQLSVSAQTTADATTDTTQPDPAPEIPDATADTPEPADSEPVAIVQSDPTTDTDAPPAILTATPPQEPGPVTITAAVEITISDDPPTVQIDATADIIIQPPPPPEPVRVKFAFKTGDSLFFNTDSTNLFGTGAILRAGPGAYSIDNELIILNEYGAELTRHELFTAPSAIKYIPDSTTDAADGGIYYCREFTTAESSAMGGMPREYSEYYKTTSTGHVTISAWYDNQDTCRGIVSAAGSVFGLNQSGAYTVIQGGTTNTLQVINDRFTIHDRDDINKTVSFTDDLGTYTENWETNYALNGTQWINHNGTEYSETGSVWSLATGLVELSTALSDFNSWPYPITPEPPFGESPVFLSVGQHNGKILWIECNNGWLFEYDPANDSLVQLWRLYDGIGTHASGITKKSSLSPFLDGSELYFSGEGAVYVLDIETGFVSTFFSGDGEVFEF